MGENFIMIPYSLIQSDAWGKKQRYSKIEAYLYLAKEARWQKKTAIIKGIKCGQNQAVFSYRELLAAWNMSNVNEVKRYLNFLESGGWIKTEKYDSATLIEILKDVKCNGNVTSNVTPNVTPNNDDNQQNTIGDVTPNVTPNVTEMYHPQDSSPAQVIKESNNIFSDIQVNKNTGLLVEVDIPLNPPREKPKGYENFDFAFADERFYDILVTWLDYRRDEKKPRFIFKNQKSLEGCYKTIIELSRGIPEAAEAIVRSCISSGYQGIFVPKGFWWDWEKNHPTSKSSSAVVNIEKQELLLQKMYETLTPEKEAEIYGLDPYEFSRLNENGKKMYRESYKDRMMEWIKNNQ